MARANRHFLPGHIWHLTHRCHNREFLLKFSRDRDRWLQLLFKARKRYGVSVLNFVATSNHVHLIVTDNGGRDAIPRTMQYVAGKTAQQFNRRKNRTGAFWQDRYHATAIESGDHLWKCIVYIDLNMVRAGVVEHPGQWRWGGFNEIQNPRKRYRIIDHEQLEKLLNVQTHEALSQSHRHWVESKLIGRQTRQASFSQSLAVGSKGFVAGMKRALGARAAGRYVIENTHDGFQLRDSAPIYHRSHAVRMQRDHNFAKSENQIPWFTDSL